MTYSLSSFFFFFFLYETLPCLNLFFCCKDENGSVACLDESRHNLESGDYVTFREIEVS